MTEPSHRSSDHAETRKKRHSFSGSFKARILFELIIGKKNLKELAERYEVHPNQIKNWKSALLKQASHVLEDKRRTRPDHRYRPDRFSAHPSGMQPD